MSILSDTCSRKDIGLAENRVCRNTVQGRYLLSDDNGKIMTSSSSGGSLWCVSVVLLSFHCSVDKYLLLIFFAP